MYLDASAIVAVLGRENDADALLERLETADPPFYVSPTTLFEATLGLAAKKARSGNRTLDAELVAQAHRSVAQFVADVGAIEIAVSSEIGATAIEAAKRYSRAVGDAADLNFGDCFAYACAKVLGVPLLYKGNDFARTDLA